MTLILVIRWLRSALLRRFEKRKHVLSASENTILLAVQIAEDTNYVLSPYTNTA